MASILPLRFSKVRQLLLALLAVALAVPATGYAAADCWKGMKMGGDHATHDMSAAPAQ